MDFKTLLIEGGTHKERYHGASSVPIFQTSTFHQELPEKLGEYDYARSGNPTRTALEETLAELENGAVGVAFASGIAAVSSTLMLFKPGDHIIVTQDVYGGTFRVISNLFSNWGLEASFIDLADAENIEKYIKKETCAIIVETPSNPLLSITDLKAVVDIAKRHKLLTIIDNTFMTPYFQKPLDLGYDIVLHSATKFLGGHSDVIAGAAVAREEHLGRRLKFVQNAFGAILGPFDSWLVLRGIRTLAVRLEEQQKTAEKIATWLAAHPKVKKVYYPGLKTHTGYEIHKAQASGAGAVLSFELFDREGTLDFLKKVKLPLVAVSLGGVETILSYPATMSHAAMPREEREKRGISDSLVRLSAGLEAFDDLQKDIENALK